MPTQLAVSPADAALWMAALMGQHSVLASDMMRARIRGDADLAQAANAALGHNTAAMAQVLGGLVDAPSREQFEKMWAEHVLALFDYARGHSSRDAALRKHAREESVEYEGELAKFFVDHSRGRLDPRTALSAVHAHAEHLLSNADAYAAGQFASAARGYRESYSHSYELGAAVARALIPADAIRALDTPSARLRSELSRLLGEHAALVMAMTRSSAGDPVDFAAMGEALNSNTLELTAAMDTLFGTPAARRFETLWADQVDQLAAYTTAAVRRDAAAQERARSALGTFQASLAGFFGSATSKRLPASSLRQALASNDDKLLAEINAYVDASFEQAYTLSSAMHETMFRFSMQLADGIGTALAARLPRGGSHTGGGGTDTAKAER